MLGPSHTASQPHDIHRRRRHPSTSTRRGEVGRNILFRPLTWTAGFLSSARDDDVDDFTKTCMVGYVLLQLPIPVIIPLLSHYCFSQ